MNTEFNLILIGVLILYIIVAELLCFINIYNQYYPRVEGTKIFDRKYYYDNRYVKWYKYHFKKMRFPFGYIFMIIVGLFIAPTYILSLNTIIFIRNRLIFKR